MVMREQDGFLETHTKCRFVLKPHTHTHVCGLGAAMCARCTCVFNAHRLHRIVSFADCGVESTVGAMLRETIQQRIPLT